MEEAPTSSSPEDGQFQNELPESLPKPEIRSANPQAYGSFATAENRPISAVPQPNTSPLRNANVEARYDPNTLPQPVEFDARATSSEQAKTQTPEIEFDKRNERLRQAPKQQDELAAAGMVALGDVLKNRQAPYATAQPPTSATTSSVRSPQHTSRSATGSGFMMGWSLYKQAVAVGLVAGLIMAPIIMIILARS